MQVLARPPLLQPPRRAADPHTRVAAAGQRHRLKPPYASVCHTPAALRRHPSLDPERSKVDVGCGWGGWTV